jgi:hypothetical protein
MSTVKNPTFTFDLTQIQVAGEFFCGITPYMDRDWTASFSIRFRNGTCIIILDKKYNIANSSGHMAVYGPVRHPKNIIWTSGHMTLLRSI